MVAMENVETNDGGSGKIDWYFDWLKVGKFWWHERKNNFFVKKKMCNHSILELW